MDHYCYALLVGEAFMGWQPWWKYKSFIALGVAALILIFWCVAIKPFIWIRGKHDIK